MDDPSTLAHASALRVASRQFEVRVASGPDAGASVVVSPRSAGRVLVGTSPSCALRLTDRRVSRRHLALDVSREGLRITDLGSTNGTTIDGLRVADAFCRGGEVLAIGDSTLRVDVDREDVEAPDVRMAFGPIVGASLAMRRLYRTCDALAASRAPLLVEGEAGTGKCALAEALHAAGSRGAAAPFVVVDGASLAIEGLLDGAAGGTLVIREIADVPLEGQTALAADVATAKARDVRVVATTRKNLDAAIEAGAFREELARELTSRIELPPLRERRGDVALLIEHVAKKLRASSSAIPPKKLAALNRHDFPGNVRELEATVAALLADAGAPIASPSPAAIPEAPEQLGLPLAYRDILLEGLPFAEAKQRVLDRFATAYVTWTVASHGGHVARAAAASGLAPRYFNILRARGRGAGGSE
jgi:DNA-binding NtrC family response regulator